MKMIYNGVPIKSLNIKHYEVSTNDCDMVASDLQAGKTAVARGKKITGTGKSFEFASYGELKTNEDWIIPTSINVVQISCLDYPIRTSVKVVDTNYLDFTSKQNIGALIYENIEYPIQVGVIDNVLSITCDKNVTLQVFYGKDNYT